MRGVDAFVLHFIEQIPISRFSMKSNRFPVRFRATRDDIGSGVLKIWDNPRAVIRVGEGTPVVRGQSPFSTGTQEHAMSEFPETNPSLILRVRDLGDGASWHDFLAIYEPVVFRMARQRGLQQADAQDVMQTVFLSIAQSIARWTGGPGEPPFRAWLTTIARNAITKALTRRPRDAAAGSTSIVDLLQNHPQREITADEIAAQTRHEIIRWACEQIRLEFSEDIWRIFWLTSIDGVPVAEVARQTGRTPGSIYVARFRVIARLKEKVMEISDLWDVREVTT